MEALNEDPKDQPAAAANEQDSESDEGSSSLGWFFTAAIAVVVAVLCFTPIWDELVSSSGRRAGFVGIIRAIGPFGIAGISLALGAIFAHSGIKAHRAGR